MNIVIPNVRLAFLAPEIILIVAACILALSDRACPRSAKSALGIFAFISTGLALACVCTQWGKPHTMLGGLFRVDNYAVFFKTVLLIIAALSILISHRFLQLEDAVRGEYYALMLLATVGMLVMVSGTDLLTIYLGLETMAIAGYVLTAYFRSEERSSEAGLKYFLLGALNSGIILYGMALLYGAAGTLRLSGIRLALLGISEPPETRLLYAAMVLLISGFGFKIAAAPFHMWAPDIYEGAPTPVAAYLSAGSKTAMFSVIIRIFMVAFGSYTFAWQSWISYIAALTMVVGNVSALRQTNVKRFMAYSSIAHVGYMLVGLASGSARGASAILLYAFVYLFANIGIFSALVYLNGQGENKQSIAAFSGLGRRHPAVAFTITVFLLSLTGIPPLGGFIGKFYLFMSAVEVGLIKLALLGLLTSVLSLFYYMRIVMVMYMEKSPVPAADNLRMSTALGYAFSIMLFAVLITGLYPEPFLDLARTSFLALQAIG